MKRYFSLQNIFLFIIIVVMPVCIAYFSVNNMIEEQYLAEREIVSNGLKYQIARIETASNTECLPEDIWYKRLIETRQNSSEKYRFPIVAINISDNTSFITDSELPQSEEFTKELIECYNLKTREIFSFKNYIVGATIAPSESELRILSLADTSDILRKRDKKKFVLKIVCLLLIVLALFLATYFKQINFVDVSLRQRIAAIFMIAIIIPLISLMSIGKIFIVHEEGRLKESAYVKMREGLESLSMRYKDTPRLIERDLYEQIKEYVGSQANSLEFVNNSMMKAVEDGTINQYVIFDRDNIIFTSWNQIDENFEKEIKYWADNVDSNETKKLKAYDGNETNGNFKLMPNLTTMSAGEPYHLRHILIADNHMYLMGIRIDIGSKFYLLFVYLNDALLEKMFVDREFSSNRLATQEQSDSLLIPEISFYHTLSKSENEVDSKNIPTSSPIWENLKEVLNRSASLKIEEKGIIKVENEEFLYLTKPLSSMNSKSYLPILMTSTKPISLRMKDITMLLFALSSLAVIGSILLSFVLSTSLLVPIRKIDYAAQQVGQGNLDVVLEKEGNDELGCLSSTFNDMIKGLKNIFFSDSHNFTEMNESAPDIKEQSDGSENDEK